MAEVMDERTYQLGEATVTLRMMDLGDAKYDDPYELARHLGVAPSVFLSFYLPAEPYRQAYLVMGYRGEASWTAIFSTSLGTGGIVAPVLWGSRGWVLTAFGEYLYGLDIAHGGLAWKFPPNFGDGYPIHALAVDVLAEVVFVVTELNVVAVRPTLWVYSHDDIVVGIRRETGLLEIEQWDGVRFWLDAKTGERVEGPGG
jgi:hypothetical protein